jgi:hypothetical protein
MSYFKDLFTSPKEGFKAFLLHVGQHNDVVVYRLDDQGRPAHFAAGKAIEVLGEPLALTDPCIFVTRPFASIPHMHDPDSWFTHASFDSWREVHDVLNTGKGPQFRLLFAIYRTLLRYAPRIEEFIELHYDEHGRTFRLTPAALEADARREQPKEETSSS